MAKYSAKGTTITINSVSIPQLREIGEQSGGEADRIDTTTHDSSNAYRDSVAGFKSEASIAVTIAFDPDMTAHQGLRTLYANGTVVPVIITLPTTPAAQITFSAYVANFPIPNLPIDGPILLTFTLAITGAITFADPTP